MGNECCTAEKPFEESLFITPKKADRPILKNQGNYSFEDPKNE